MGKIRRVLRCHNCGAILQSDDEKAVGYISKDILEGTSPRIPYCNSCYEKMLLLNSSELEDKVNSEILTILDDAVATDAYVIWVVDLFTFNGTLNKEICKKVSKLNVAVVGTKRDLFPNNIKNQTFERFLKERFEEFGVSPSCIRIIGNENSIDFNDFYKSLNSARKGHDVYMLGATGAGKTTIINKMLKSYENKSKWTIRTATYPGTEAKVLEIPLSNSSFFYEMPDLSISNSIVSKVEKETLKHIVPHKKLEITTKTIAVKEFIAVGCVAAIELIKGKNTTFKFYAAKPVEYKRLLASKGMATFQKDFKRHDIRPISDRFSLYTDFDIFEYTMENDGLIHDISIEGLLTASFVSKGQIIRVTAPKGVAIKESLAKVR